MIIPIDQVNKETLDNIIESYVLGEGTDYGEMEKSLEEKVNDVRRQLIEGTAVLVYSQLHETVNILPKAQFEQGYEQEQAAQQEYD